MGTKKQQLLDYFILCARVLIAWTFCSYGWSKLVDQQFGLTPQQLATPVKDLGLFRLSWYLFDQEPFKSFIGISQMVAGVLLLYNRTLILGAFLSIPILVNILIVDITFLKMPSFYWRLSYYLFLDLCILWHYRERLVSAFHQVFAGLSTQFKYPLWAYLILPFMAIVLEIIGVLPKLLTDMVLHPTETIHALSLLPDQLLDLMHKISR